MIIEGGGRGMIRAWSESLKVADLFPNGKIPSRRQWSRFEVILNGLPTGATILRKRVVHAHEVDVARTEGPLRMLKDPRTPHSRID